MGKGLSQTSTFKTDRDDLEDYLRRISTLPLALKGADGYTGLAPRAFSLNDFKAILAQTMPPQHYVGRWEVASGEFWHILEQPEEKTFKTAFVCIFALCGNARRAHAGGSTLFGGRLARAPHSALCFCAGAAWLIA